MPLVGMRGPFSGSLWAFYHIMGFILLLAQTLDVRAFVGCHWLCVCWSGLLFEANWILDCWIVSPYCYNPYSLVFSSCTLGIACSNATLLMLLPSTLHASILMCSWLWLVLLEYVAQLPNGSDVRLCRLNCRWLPHL